MPATVSFGAEQPALEPAILDPCQMLDDARDRHIRRWQQAGRGLLPLQVDERGRCNRSVLIEALHERCALVPGLEIRMWQISAYHQLILAGSRGTTGPLAKNPAPDRRDGTRGDRQRSSAVPDVGFCRCRGTSLRPLIKVPWRWRVAAASATRAGASKDLWC